MPSDFSLGLLIESWRHNLQDMVHAPRKRAKVRPPIYRSLIFLAEKYSRALLYALCKFYENRHIPVIIKVPIL